MKRWLPILLLSISSTAFAEPVAFQDGLKKFLKGKIHEAVEIWTQLANQGDAKSQNQLGQFYLTDHGRRDFDQAVYWYRKAADQGDTDAVRRLENAQELQTTWSTLAREVGAKAAYQTITFREHLHEGEDTNCGFVVEVKTKIVLVQTDDRPRWFKKKNVYLPGTQACVSQPQTPSP